MVDSMASRSAMLRVAEFDSIVFGMISLLSWANSFCVRSFNVCEDSIFCVKGFGAYVGFGSGAFRKECHAHGVKFLGVEGRSWRAGFSPVVMLRCRRPMHTWYTDHAVPRMMTQGERLMSSHYSVSELEARAASIIAEGRQIGRASCRERV